MQIPPDQTMRSKLLDLLARCQATEQALLAQLTEAERTATGTPDHWAIKDYLVHITAWRQQSADRLTKTARGETPNVIVDFQPFNEQTFERERQTPWAQVLADAEQAHQDLAAAVRGCAEEDLTDPARAPWRQGEPLWWMVLGNGFEHPYEHYATILSERGDIAQAGEMQRGVVATVNEVFPGSERAAIALYNLGCFYAKTGQAAPAIEAVRESLAQAPRLVEWSKQDSDLDSLRGDPAFQAIYSG